MSRSPFTTSDEIEGVLNQYNLNIQQLFFQQQLHMEDMIASSIVAM